VTAISLVGGAAFLAACAVLSCATFVWVERSGRLDLDALVGSEHVTKGMARLAPVFVEINAQGWAFVSGRRVTPVTLRELLHKAVRICPEQRVVFRLTESTPTQSVGPFLEACVAAGARHVHLMEATSGGSVAPE
jgi:biopolymer transport protein ExbD